MCKLEDKFTNTCWVQATSTQNSFHSESQLAFGEGLTFKAHVATDKEYLGKISELDCATGASPLHSPYTQEFIISFLS